MMKTPAARMACDKKNCDKSYVNKGSLKTHMRKQHQTDGLMPSPLGSFPPLVLFTDTPGPAVQGDSAGNINSPAVYSEAKFVCQICETGFDLKEDLNNHAVNQHGPENRELVELQEDSEDAMIAKELEDMVELV